MIQLGLLLWLIAFNWSTLLNEPYSTPIRITGFTETKASAPAHDLEHYCPVTRKECENTQIRLGFAGDIMQHRQQRKDLFATSYSKIAPLIQSFDLAVANLEFPISPYREVGPPPRSVRFNGSESHVKALGKAGFDLLSTANNHAFDQGLEGIHSTRAIIAKYDIGAFGTAEAHHLLQQPYLIDVKGIRLAFFGYTYGLNKHSDEYGNLIIPGRDTPVSVLHFQDWSDEYRAVGKEILRRDVGLAKKQGGEFLIAFAHWGEEWDFRATEDQQLAAQDMIDSGFDLVIGSHSHVLGSVAIYKGKLIVYSLGTLLSAFRPLAPRVSALLEVDVRRIENDKVRVSDFRFYPTCVELNSRLIRRIHESDSAEHGQAWKLAANILGSSLK